MGGKRGVFYQHETDDYGEAGDLGFVCQLLDRRVIQEEIGVQCLLVSRDCHPDGGQETQSTQRTSHALSLAR